MKIIPQKATVCEDGNAHKYDTDETDKDIWSETVKKIPMEPHKSVCSPLYSLISIIMSLGLIFWCERANARPFDDNYNLYLYLYNLLN